jgi:hypothetical protein
MNRFLGKRSRWSAVFAGVLTLCSYSAIRLLWSSEDQGLPLAEAPGGSHVANIIVGPNIHVSTAYPAYSHHESVVAADPSQAQRLFAFAMYHLTNPPSIVGYVSEDGGKSWQPSFDRRPGPGETALNDPSLAFGPDGTLYLVYLAWGTAKPSEQETSLVFFRCADGRAKWERLSTVQHNNPNPPPDPALPWQRCADRPWLAVDRTMGQGHGRIYCASWLWLDASADQGRTFTSLPQPARKKYVDYMPANPVVLSDGTLVLARRLRSSRPHDLPGVSILLSDDGGQTLREGPLVGTDRYDERANFGVASVRFQLQLATDTSGSTYRDRVYVVWEDGQLEANVPVGRPQRPGPGRILFAFSNNKGHSWIGPMILSEQPANPDNSYGAYMPAVAVNKAGYVAATWYDRRGLPSAPGSTAPFHTPGCNVRIRVSLDGGETWQPSVQVNETAIKSSVWDLRDTAGLAADAAGTFHPVWIDDRTGTTQVWTAAVRVEKR